MALISGNMKRIIITLLSTILIAGCGNDSKESKTVDITGQWELMDMQTKAIQIGEVDIEVYLEFNADKTFNIWQKIGEGRHRKFTGTWEITDNNLSGKYSDGKEWGSVYEVSIEDGNLNLSETRSGTETYVYHKCQLPAGLK